MKALQFQVTQFASSAFIAVLSFDRFLAVCRPLTSSSWRSINTAILLSLLTWAMIILEMTPLLIFTKVVKYYGLLKLAKLLQKFKFQKAQKYPKNACCSSAKKNLILHKPTMKKLKTMLRTSSLQAGKILIELKKSKLMSLDFS